MPGVFEALADPTRRRILELAAVGEHTVGEMVDALRREMTISQPAVSQHLKVLREAKLARARADGKHRYYTVDEAGLDAALTWLAHLTDPIGSFAQPLDALATEVARGRRERRDEQIDEPAPRPRRPREDRSA